jgi:hypothetical protein
MQFPGLVLSSLVAIAMATPAPATIPDRIEHHLQSAFPAQERVIVVDLPTSYETSSLRRYPVLYILDGESNLDHAVAVTDFLAEVAQIPELIVVGIHAGPTRARDYLPAGEVQLSGQADQFLDFLEKELIPFVSNTYSAGTLRLLSGHSLGGVLVTYALAERPDLFQGYFAQSPYLDASIAAVQVDRLGERLHTTSTLDAFYFANLGDEPDLAPGFEQLAKTVSTATAAGFAGLTAHEITASHMSTRLVGLHDALVTYFADVWPLPTEVLGGEGASALVRHLEALEKRFGESTAFSESAFQKATQGLLRAGDMAGAAKAAELYLEDYPASPVAHYLRGVSLASGGQREAGIQSIEKAIALYESAPDPALEKTYGNMKRVLARLRAD